MFAFPGEIRLHFLSIIVTETLRNFQSPLDETDDNDAPSGTLRHMECVTYGLSDGIIQVLQNTSHCVYVFTLVPDMQRCAH